MPTDRNYTWIPGPMRSRYAVRGAQIFAKRPSMSVTVRGVGSLNSDIESATASVGASLEAAQVLLNDAITQGRLKQVDGALFQSELVALRTQYNATAGQRPSQDVLDALTQIGASLESWRTRLSAKSGDTLLVRVFVWGGLAIAIAGGTAFYFINRSLKRRRRRVR